MPVEQHSEGASSESNCASWILESAAAEGTDHAFMCPGGLNDAFMPPLTGTPGMRTVVAAFEGGAAYMADGWSRASGGMGLCLGIGGPGVLNMATALGAAAADRSQVLAVSGEVPTTWEGLGGFQDASGAALDDLDAIRPMTSTSLSVDSSAVLPHHLRRAMTAARVKRRPAHLSVPVDVQKAPAPPAWDPMPRELSSAPTIDMDAFDRLAGLFEQAEGSTVPENVVLLAGEAVLHSNASEDLVAFAERFSIPVATTLSAKGAISEDHPLALGVFGYGGSRWATEAILSNQVEVLLVVGSALTQRDTLQWDQRMLPSQALVQIAGDPMHIGATWTAEIPVIADSREALVRLAALDGAAARGLEAGRPARAGFLDSVRAEPRRYSEADTTSDAVPMHPARVVNELRAAMPDHATLSVDSGAHRAWFAEYWTVREAGTHFSLTALGPMGGAIPLAIGAQLARPDRPAMVATGDGCMLMHGMELHTAAREGVPLIVALMDNHAYGNIWYRAHVMGAGPSGLTDIPLMDWVGFAHSVGARGERVEHPGEIAAAVGRALDSAGPYLLDLRIDKHPPTPIAPWREAVQEWEDDH
ncbi:MAG: thiamine pyrophosphate-binding protein [Microthrixaceae bacterium]